MSNNQSYIQIATLEIDPSRLADYHAAVTAQAIAAIENEPGVLVLNAVSDRDDPTRITVFEIYRDRAAYERHLKAEHFLKYKVAVGSMVISLKLSPVTPVILATKANPD
jgi:quinol monooxygenase YgiN